MVAVKYMAAKSIRKMCIYRPCEIYRSSRTFPFWFRTILGIFGLGFGSWDVKKVIPRLGGIMRKQTWERACFPRSRWLEPAGKSSFPAGWGLLRQCLQKSASLQPLIPMTWNHWKQTYVAILCPNFSSFIQWKAFNESQTHDALKLSRNWLSCHFVRFGPILCK